MKKLITLLLTAVMAVAACFSLTACGDDKSNARTIDFSMGAEFSNTYYAMFAESIPEDFKIGFIFLHDEKSPYDLNFYDAAKEAVAVMGLKADQVVYKFNVPESQACYDAAKEMIDGGAKAIFADSFGHGTYMAQAAKDFPNVQFYHATGTGTSVADAPANLHNAFAQIYVGRYLGGVAAGMKLNEMAEEDPSIVKDGKIKVGYVGAFPYAEVKSGYTSWYLGVKAACTNDVTMEVKFTNSWYDEVAEKSAAESLIANGCVLLSQHADSMGAPTACEKAGVPNVSYNGSTVDKCPNTFIVSSRIDWAPYFKMIIASFSAKYVEVTADTYILPDDAEDIDSVYVSAATFIKETIGKDFTAGDMALIGSVKMSAINADVMAKGTPAKLAEEMMKIMYEEDPSIYIFDCSKFTVTVSETKNKGAVVDGEGHLISYLADVVDDGTFTPDTDVILTEDGVTFFSESTFRSAPYFDIDIDGITIIG